MSGNLFQDGQGFNPEDHPDEGFAIPKGEYTLVASKSEVKKTKAGTGTYLCVRFNVIDGACKGKFIEEIYNLTNPSQKAAAIGMAQLAKLCKACGKKAIRDSSELHNIPFVASVDVENSGGYARNRIKAYKARSESFSQPGSGEGIGDSPGGGVPWSQ